jgi:hypothetical protein
MKKMLVFIFLICLLSCKNIPVIKTSPEIAKITYAVKDSFEAARIDLADNYTDQLITLISPPITKIPIKPLYKNGKRIAVIPKKFQSDEVIVIDSQEWSKLLQIKDIATQLSNDVENLKKQLSDTEKEKREQEQIKIDLAAKNTELTINKEYSDKIIFKLKVYLVSIAIIICLYFYLKIKKIIPL